jgi:hypothetical protein
MNPRLLRVCLLAAMPALLPAQEVKLVNCRTLEAAGNFVGPDEVIDGNLVCQKLKPGTSAPAKSQPTKSESANSQPETAIVPEQPMSVADAARANRQRLAAKQASVTGPGVATPPPAVEAPTTLAKPVSSDTAKEAAHVAASAPTAAAPPAETTAVGPVGETAVPVAPASGRPVPREPATSAPRTRITRDAPVAAGTPSEPPEKDYGFSDANAVETPPTAPRAEAESGAKISSATRAQVQVGAFDKPTAATAVAESPERSLRADAALPEGQRTDCTKNVTLASMKDEKFAPAAPSWAQAWVAKNQKAMANVCFSAAPMSGAKNYLLVFYMMPDNSNAAIMPMPDARAGAFTAKDGAWHYTGNVSTALPVPEQGPIWYATAYTDDGAAIAEQWPEQAKRGDNERVSDELMRGIVESLRKQ